MSATKVLAQLDEFTAAAEQIVTDPDLTEGQKAIGIASLADRALEHPDPSWRPWLQRAVERGAWAWFHPAAPPLVDAVGGLCRSLLNDGYKVCPSCHRLLPTRDDLDRWNRLSFAALAGAAVS